MAGIPTAMSEDEVAKKLENGTKHLKLHVYVKEMEQSEPDPVFKTVNNLSLRLKCLIRKVLWQESQKSLPGHGVNVTNLQALFEGGDDPNKKHYEITSRYSQTYKPAGFTCGSKKKRPTNWIYRSASSTETFSRQSIAFEA